MSYKCLDCGHIFEEGEQSFWSESHGLDYPPYEKISGCPLCKGSYEETTPCDICGAEHIESELIGGVCEECFEEYRYDIDMCYKIGSIDKSAIEINCFLASLFDIDEIEKILFDSLKEGQKYGKIDCEKFIEEDRSWFGERLAEEVKKNENAKG